MFELSNRPPTVRKTPNKLKTITQQQQNLLPIIEYWNSLPQIPTTPEYQGISLTRHKINGTGTESKQIHKLLEKIELIVAGRFFSVYPNTAFYDRSMPPEFINKEQIIPITAFPFIFKTYRQYFEPGLGTLNKSLLQTTLGGFIGQNEIKVRGIDSFRNNKSWFWQIVDAGPEVPNYIKHVDSTRIVLEKYRHLIHLLQDLLQRTNYKKAFTHDEVTGAVAKLFVAYLQAKQNAEDKFNSIRPFVDILGSFEAFFNTFIDFVKSQNYEELWLGHFDPNRTVYRLKFQRKMDEFYLEL